MNPPFSSTIVSTLTMVPPAEVIPLKLFLDILPSSSADIARVLRGCFRGGSVYVSLRFVSKQSKTSGNAAEMYSLTF